MQIRLREIKQDNATTGQVPAWDGTKWAPSTPAAGGGSASFTHDWVQYSDGGTSVVSGSSTGVQVVFSDTYIQSNTVYGTARPAWLTYTSGDLVLANGLYSVSLVCGNNQSPGNGPLGIKLFHSATALSGPSFMVPQQAISQVNNGEAKGAIHETVVVKTSGHQLTLKVLSGVLTTTATVYTQLTIIRHGSVT